MVEPSITDLNPHSLKVNSDSLPQKSPIRWVFCTIFDFFERGLGFCSAIVLISFLCTIPLLNLLGFGYLLYCQKRIYETGRIRSGLPGWRKILAIGRLMVVGFILFHIVRFFEEKAWKQKIILGEASEGAQWIVTLMFMIVLWHLWWASMQGLGWRHILIPAPIRFSRWLLEPFQWKSIFKTPTQLFKDFKIVQLLVLGWKCFLGTFIWLIPMTFVFIAGVEAKGDGPHVIFVLLGTVSMAYLVLKIPVLQVIYTQKGCIRSLFRIKEAKRLFLHAPWAIGSTLILVMVLTLPTYLLQVESIPWALKWFIGIPFIFLCYFARILIAKAVAYANSKSVPASKWRRWTMRLLLWPIALSYGITPYLSLYIGWEGYGLLLDQQIFLIPLGYMGFRT